VIWPKKSLRWFLGLSLETKWEEVCLFVPQNRCADEDGVSTRVNIWWLASLGSKLGYGFSVSPQNWQRSDDEWCMWHECGGSVDVKQKMIVRWCRVQCSGIRTKLPFSRCSFPFSHRGILVSSFSMNRTPRVGGKDQAFIHPSSTP
jgi:hypothetical protein